MRAIAVVPTYDNPQTVGAVVRRLRAHGLEVLVVDDGSGPAGRAACAALVAEPGVTVIHRERNGGKGAACQTGFAHAWTNGYSHALQVDADGQHDVDRTPAFLAAARERPDALVLGYPEYDASAPAQRRHGRQLTNFWVALEVGSRRTIRDAMIGFRVYPLAAVQQLPRLGRGMDFDIEVCVRLVRAGVPTVNLPVRVRYLSRDEGGISHFRPLRDNLRFAWLHSRLCTIGCMQWTLRRLWPFGRRTRPDGLAS